LVKKKIGAVAFKSRGKEPKCFELKASIPGHGDVCNEQKKIGELMNVLSCDFVGIFTTNTNRRESPVSRQGSNTTPPVGQKYPGKKSFPGICYQTAIFDKNRHSYGDLFSPK